MARLASVGTRERERGGGRVREGERGGESATNKVRQQTGRASERETIMAGTGRSIGERIIDGWQAGSFSH